ncbi:Os05g0513450, partial [Oryza sativa Japonica Group]
MHITQPRTPSACNLSFRIKCASTALTIMLSAPRGVTRTAGAKAYATKLATSPTITERRELRKKNRKSGLGRRPARMPEATAARRRPFFLMMKLAPMKPLERSARTIPFTLSVDNSCPPPP